MNEQFLRFVNSSKYRYQSIKPFLLCSKNNSYHFPGTMPMSKVNAKILYAVISGLGRLFAYMCFIFQSCF